MIKPLVAQLLVAVLCCVSSAQTPSRDKRPVRDPATGSQRGSTAKEQALAAYSVDDVLWWLPEDTQTVSVARGPFQITALEAPDDISFGDYLKFALTVAPLANFVMIEDGMLAKPLLGKNVLFAVEGSRKFRPPKSLGGMLFEGCSITVFEGRPLSTIFTRMASHAKRIQHIEGHQVL